MADPIRTLIVDDDAPFRQAIRTLLKDAGGVMTVGEARDGLEAVAMARKLRPDIVLLALDTLPSGNLQAVAQLRELSRASRVIVFSTPDQEHLVLDALRQGAQGHLIKGESTPLDVVDAIHAVSEGDSILSPRMTGWILDEMVKRSC